MAGEHITKAEHIVMTNCQEAGFQSVSLEA